MSRPRAGYIGFNRVPAASALNSAASGVWTLREAESMRRAGTWPSAGNVVTAIAGLQLWLDASDASTLFDATTGGSLVAADGGVARWEDKSGNARHMTQGTNGSRPTRKTAIQNNLAVLRFDGSNDFMSVPSSTATFAFLHSAASTVFAVLKVASNSADGTRIYGTRVGGSNRGSQLTHWNSSVTARIRHNATNGEASNDDVIDNYSANNFFTTNSFRLISLVSNAGAAAGSRSSLRVNGGAATANNSVSNAASSGNSSHDLTIADSPAGGSALNGDIAEIIIYDTALSDTDRSAVESYLMNKWGII